MKSILEDIKNQDYKKVYLLYGDEAYLKQQYKHRLLQALVSSPGRVFTREVLLAKLWGYDFFGDERVVDSHIKNLRRKLGVDYIETVRGAGYRAAKENP